MKTKRKRHRFHARRTRPGTAPGTLAVDPEAPPPRITAIAYGPDGLVEQPIADLAELDRLRDLHPVIWVNVDGLGDSEVVAAIGGRFGLHRLALEDVVNVHQRPKVEDYGSNVFVVARMPIPERPPESEQFALFLGEGFIVTFQERPGDCLEPVRLRLRQGAPRLRGSGPDYLAYAMLDAIVDAYFPTLEQYGERLDTLESDILAHPDNAQLRRLHILKHDLAELRRLVWSHREVFVVLTREKSRFIDETTGIYLRDCYDHTIQLAEMIDVHREIGASLMDLHLSMVSNRMNEVMKVLTIIATIFIPLGFVAGLYGMNFDTSSPWNMPELGWRFGYPFVLGFMLATAVAMLVFFRRRGWLGGAGADAAMDDVTRPVTPGRSGSDAAPPR
ncbi:MAG: magnesium/cobalt transporter CorA [Candidatus Eiseniibacteriota bacterium]|jgi:magnesium transporter